MDHITGLKDQMVTQPSYFQTTFLQPLAQFITKDFLTGMTHNYMLRLGLLSDGWGMGRIFDHTSTYEWILLLFAVYSLVSRFRTFSSRAMAQWLAEFLFATLCFGLLLSVSARREAIIPSCGWRRSYLGFGSAKYGCIPEKLACAVGPHFGILEQQADILVVDNCAMQQQLLSFYAAAALRVFILQGKVGIWFFVVAQIYNVAKSLLSDGFSGLWRTSMETFRRPTPANPKRHAITQEGELADHLAAPH